MLAILSVLVYTKQKVSYLDYGAGFALSIVAFIFFLPAIVVLVMLTRKSGFTDDGYFGF